MPYRKLSLARQKLQTKGFAGVLAHYPRRWLRHVQSYDLLWGAIVELRRNRVRIDGLKFNVKIPGMTTAQKSRFLFDRYERPERILIKQFLDPNLPVVEFGANIGVISCIVNSRLRDRRQHVAVEANPLLIPVLAENRRANNCEFEIINSAVAYGANKVRFNLSDDCLASSVQTVGSRTINIPTITLKHVIDSRGWRTCTLVCDIEGGETEFVEWESDVIREHVEKILMETHAKSVGKTAIDSMMARLTNIGFTVLFNRWSNVVLQRKR